MGKVIDLREYRRMKEMVRIKNYHDFPAPGRTTGLMIAKVGGNPAVIIFAGGKEYEIFITNGFRVRMMNSFLNSLNLGVDVKFSTFLQYGNLIAECDELLRERNKKNSVISM